MIVEYDDDFNVRYKAKESDQWKTVGIDELILNYLDTRWIPVTERLPEKNGRYLVTNSALRIVDWNIWVNGEWLYPNGAVVAWMPLPDAYEVLNERSE